VFSSDYEGEVVGASHAYDSVKVDEDGKALIENK
jgi:hypothetical protein